MASSLNTEGKRYADRSKSSAIVSQLLDQRPDNYRRQLERSGVKPKNHHKDNLKMIKMMQDQVKENRNKQEPKQKKSAKWSKVDSKLKTRPHTKSMEPLAPASAKNFILQNKSNIHSQSAGNATILKKQYGELKRKPAVPKVSDLKIQKTQIAREEQHKDFVSLNKTKLVSTRATKSDQGSFMDQEGYGKVPDYLVLRKIEKDQMEQKKMEEEELMKIPPGMRVMGLEEKQQTLKILEINKADVIDCIRNLPLVIETPSIKKYEKELHRKMKEIEDTIRIFQKPTVYVAMEE